MNSNDFKEVYDRLDISIDKLGCVMLDVAALKNMYTIEVEGAGCALYCSRNKDRFWIDGWVADKTPHITLLYGLLEKAYLLGYEIKSVLGDWNCKEVEIESVGYFDSPYEDEPYWCLVAHIKVTDVLLEGRARLEFLPHINTFPGYKPHMTICYLEKNQGEAYRDNMIAQFNEMWSGKKMEVTKINLGHRKE